MKTDSNDRETLQFSRGNLLAAAVILGIGWMGAFGVDRRHDESMEQVWIPEVHRLTEKSIRCEPMGITIDSPDGFVFYAVDQQSPDLNAISFVNHRDKVVGRIATFDPSSQPWPPAADQFLPQLAEDDPTMGDRREPENDFDWQADESSGDHTLRTADSETDGLETEFGLPINSLAFGTLSDSRLQTCTTIYRQVEVEWVSPMKSPSWPFRIHQGRCALSDRTLLISVFELDSRSPAPVYDEGPIAAIANAISPNDS
ncbi:hypothetical protein [Roseiconus lacunae]|uniref:hypothetical protein n=1 Tax=Roseiconus lacunae TaxID=2605694 RepID=UPI001E411EAC|nr:hypothetical protein [Roseiconus lacunae]MCD0460427.1 hypothetical protein [Roseiconus lacunae]